MKQIVEKNSLLKVDRLSNVAPVVLFVYSRVLHTRRTIEALRDNYLADCTDLIIYSDYPKSNEVKDEVKEVREYIKNVMGFKSVKIYERPYNYGLSKSIIEGITDTLKNYERVIVLEDDLVTSRYFLTFMNEGLELYKDSEKVISIHGYCFPSNKELPETFFLPGADCWGWATWKKSWEIFEPDGKELLRRLDINNLASEFDVENSYPFTEMLRSQVSGLIDSWAIRWYASAFLSKKITLYPGKSLVKNIGNDQSGTHSAATNIFNVKLGINHIGLSNIPIEVSIYAMKEYRYFLIKMLPFRRRIFRLALFNLKKIFNLN
jgi:hypothetical protein